jgi:IS4 transposase
MLFYRDLKDIYKKRWGIETSFRELKHTLGAIYLKSKKMEHIQQEVYGKMLLYNFSSIITLNVVIEHNPNRNIRYQVNFSMAMTICIKFLKYYNDTQP